MKANLKTFAITVACLFTLIGYSRAGGPTLEGGLLVSILPDGGFTITAPPTKPTGRTYRTAKELFAYMVSQPVTDELNIRRNGIWVSAQEPSAYSKPAIADFNSLITLCAKKQIPIHLQRPADIQWRPALPDLNQKP